jgi:hypothetical protein
MLAGVEEDGMNLVQGLNGASAREPGISEHLRLLTDANDEMEIQL